MTKGKVNNPSAIAEVREGGFLVLRAPGALEILPKKSNNQKPVTLELGKKELCFSHDTSSKGTGSSHTTVAVLTDNEDDPVKLYVWSK